jgi:hypothetical protein
MVENEENKIRKKRPQTPTNYNLVFSYFGLSSFITLARLFEHWVRVKKGAQIVSFFKRNYQTDSKI